MTHHPSTKFSAQIPAITDPAGWQSSGPFLALYGNQVIAQNERSASFNQIANPVGRVGDSGAAPPLLTSWGP